MAAINIILKAVDQYSSTITGLNQGFSLIGKAVDKIKGGLDLAISAVKGLADAAAGLAKSFNAVGETFEELEIRFNAVFGKGRVADNAIEWAAKFGAQTPLSLDQVADRMIKLKSAGFDPMNESLGLMQKLGDTTFALGMDFDRLLNPLRKLNSGGKATFESINQLAEAGIPIYEILNEQMGLTAEQVQKIADQNISGRDIVYKIIDGISKRYEGAMLAASNTSKGALATIGDTVEVFQKKMLDAGLWDRYVKKIIDVRDLLDKTLGSETGDRIAKALGTGISDAFDRISAAVGSSLGGISQTFETVWNRLTELSGDGADRIVIYTQNAAGEIVKHFHYVGTKATEPMTFILRAWNELIDEINKKPLFGTSLFLIEKSLKSIELILSGFGETISGAWNMVSDVVSKNMEKIYDITSTVAAKTFEKIGEILDGLSQEVMNFYRIFGGSAVLEKIGLGDSNLLSAASALEKWGASMKKQSYLIKDEFNTLEKAAGAWYKPIAKSNEELKVSQKSIEAFADKAISEFNQVDRVVSETPPWAQSRLEALSEIAEKEAEEAEKAIKAMTFNMETEKKRFFGEVGNTLSEFGMSLSDLDSDISLLDKLEAKALSDAPELSAVNRGVSEVGGAADQLAAANWPAEFQALGDFMFKWVLSVASGSSFPMAVTTGF